jgi:hypothetical protein
LAPSSSAEVAVVGRIASERVELFSDTSVASEFWSKAFYGKVAICVAFILLAVADDAPFILAVLAGLTFDLDVLFVVIWLTVWIAWFDAIPKLRFLLFLWFGEAIEGWLGTVIIIVAVPIELCAAVVFVAV